MNCKKKKLIELVLENEDFKIKESGKKVKPVPVGIPTNTLGYNWIRNEAPKNANAYVLGKRVVEWAAQGEISGSYFPIQYYKINNLK